MLVVNTLQPIVCYFFVANKKYFSVNGQAIAIKYALRKHKIF